MILNEKISEMAFCTPKKPDQNKVNRIVIPASPFMKKIGYGTGVAVYELQRSPAFNKFRSPWAIKKLIQRKMDNSIAKTRLKSEAEVLRKLVHPNIVGFRAYLEKSNGDGLLAMEECSISLGDLIEEMGDKNEDPFKPNIITKVSLDIVQGLSYLHNVALLVHCDVKSYNVLVKGDFEICKLCDFGVCLPITKEGYLDKEKAPNGVYEGTRAWSPPEVLGYTQDITTKVDIYSFGIVMWEMIALCPPITEEAAECISKCINIDPGQLDDILETMTTCQRPSIPENITLGEEYKYVLEIFYCCTSQNKEERPAAADLVILFKNIYVSSTN